MNHDVILIGQAGLGSGDMKLGGMILANFLRLLGERQTLPKYIVLWNEGVKIAVQDSAWLNHLMNLEAKGIKIVSCQTCVEYFGLVGKIAVGEVTGMVQIQEIIFARRVLTV